MKAKAPGMNSCQTLPQPEAPAATRDKVTESLAMSSDLQDRIDDLVRTEHKLGSIKKLDHRHIT